jgi:integrase
VRGHHAAHVEALLASATRKDSRPGPLNDGSKEQILNVIRQVLDYAVEERAIPANPARQINKKRRPRQGKLTERILGPDEQTRLLAYCGRVPWLRPIILVAVLQALRLGEVLALRPKDVDFKAGKLTVLRSLRKDGSFGPTKGWKETDPRELHVIDLHPQAAEILRSLTPLSPEAPYFRNTLGEQRAYQDWARRGARCANSRPCRLTRACPASTISGTRRSADWRTLPALRFPGCRSSLATRRFRPPMSTFMKSAMRSASRPHGQPCRSKPLEHDWNTDSGITGNGREATPGRSRMNRAFTSRRFPAVPVVAYQL